MCYDIFSSNHEDIRGEALFFIQIKSVGFISAMLYFIRLMGVDIFEINCLKMFYTYVEQRYFPRFIRVKRRAVINHRIGGRWLRKKQEKLALTYGQCR